MNTYIYKKSVDWSVLQQGFSIPVSLQIVFQQHIKQYLPRGTRQKIKLLIDNESYEAHLVNQNFDIAKYPTHKDIIQFRYTPKSATAKKMRQIFATTYHYCLDYKTNNPKRRQIKIAKEQQEYLMLYTTALQNTFLLD